MVNVLSTVLKTPKDRTQYKKWIKALRSGSFSQGKSRLQGSQGYCCLGVACKLLIEEENLKKESGGTLVGNMPRSAQPNAPKWLQDIGDVRFTAANGKQLPILNDVDNYTFAQIADVLEKEYKEM